MKKLIYFVPLITTLIGLIVVYPTAVFSLEPDDVDWGTSEDTREVWFSPIRDKDPLVGHVTHHNKETFGNAYERKILDSDIGEIIVRISRTQNSACNPGCPDTIDILAIPEGYVASPTSYLTEEGEVSNIKIYRYIGG